MPQPVSLNDPGLREEAAQWVHIDDLDPWEKNPRKNDEAAPKLAKLIVKLGFGSALLAWVSPETGRKQILGGHTRKKAVQILQRKLPTCSKTQRLKWHPDAVRTAETGMLPVRVRTDLTPEQAHQLAIADNKANEWAEWDQESLIGILSEFSLPDVEDMGFDPSKLDRFADDLYGLGGDLEKEVKLDTSFQVVITVESEEEQLAVIEWAQEMGHKCRALI
jgi:ParB family chromosome partitioning protein